MVKKIKKLKKHVVSFIEEATLDSVEKRVKSLLGDSVEAKLQTLERRRKVAYLAVFDRICHGECEELHYFIPPSPFIIGGLGVEPML